MATLQGTLRNLVGASLTSAEGLVPRVVLVYVDEAGDVDGEVRIGPTEISIDAAGTFNVTDIPDGDYRIQARYYEPLAVVLATAQPVAISTSPVFTVAGATQLAVALGLALLSGPETLVFSVDTDGRFYYVPDGTGTHSIFLDTDGHPYIAAGPGGEDVYSDVDGVPVVLTATG